MKDETSNNPPDLNVHAVDGVGVKDASMPANQIKFVVTLRAKNNEIKSTDIDALVDYIYAKIEEQGWKFTQSQQE